MCIRDRWWSISRYLSSDENPRQWAITDLDPEKTPECLAGDLADHFTSITNLADRLELGQIPRSRNGDGLVRLLEEKQVAGRLKKFKKPQSRVDGDLPRAIVNQSAEALARPLTLIYNYCFLERQWPTIWKRETVVPIPKIPTPGGFNDIRPISMTPLWSKLLESYIAGYTLIETSQNWKTNQHGGRKGSSTDHVLIQMWDTILSELDSASDKSKAAVLCGIDFSKSFSRCSYQLILDSYIDLGASQWVLDMHAAFLVGRSMQVKVGNVLSTPR